MEREAEVSLPLVCSICGVPKPETEFYERTPGVPRKDCKTCVRVRVAKSPTSAARRKARDERKANPKPKVTAEQTKARMASWYRDNRERQYALHLKWNAQNRDKASGYASAWAKKNPAATRDSAARYRARKVSRALVVTKRDVDRLVARYASLCAYCSERPYEHLDHVIPLSCGGWHSIGNLLPACGFCNIQKNSKTVTEWRMWLIKRMAA